MQDLNDIFAAEEERLLAEGRAAIAAADAAWNALPQAERDRIQAERAARLDALPDEPETDDEEYEDEEEDDDDE